MPIPQEGHIGGDPLVSGCVMFGREREQPGLIIEPKAPFDPADSAALVDFRNKIWYVDWPLITITVNKRIPGLEFRRRTSSRQPSPRSSKR